MMDDALIPLVEGLDMLHCAFGPTDLSRYYECGRLAKGAYRLHRDHGAAVIKRCMADSVP